MLQARRRPLPRSARARTGRNGAPREGGQPRLLLEIRMLYTVSSTGSTCVRIQYCSIVNTVQCTSICFACLCAVDVHRAVCARHVIPQSERRC